MRLLVLLALLTQACFLPPETRNWLLGPSFSIPLPNCAWTGLWISTDAGRCYREVWKCDDGRDEFLTGPVWCQ